MTLGELDIRRTPPVSGGTSLRRAWKAMQAENMTTLCVTDDAGALEGLITLKDISTANLDGLDAYVLAKTETSFENLADTLDGKVLSGEVRGKTVTGHIVVGAGSSGQMEHAIRQGDIVIVSNRSSGQLTAIEAHAGCLVVCTGVEVSRAIRLVAEEQNCLIISTPHTVFGTAQIIAQAAPVGYYMLRENLLTFTTDTTVADAVQAVSGVRHRYFPVLDQDGRYYGMVSHRNLLNQ